jgi:hypothetical protein
MYYLRQNSTRALPIDLLLLLQQEQMKIAMAQLLLFADLFDQNRQM